MENIKGIYEYYKQEDRQANKQTKKGNQQKRDLIIKNKNLKVRLEPMHIDISNGTLSQVYGIYHIQNLYIHKDILLNIADCYMLSKYVNIYFIDAYGNKVAKYKRKKIL